MIESLKDLEKLLKLCRKQGVTKIKLATIELELGEMPGELKTVLVADESEPYANFPQGELTPEQLMFYSAGGKPEDDPENIQ